MTRRVFVPLSVLLLLATASTRSRAQTITVVPATAGPLTVTTAVAGQEPTSVSTSGGTYTVVTLKNTALTTITARLSAPLPANTTLTITLASPGGTAVSVGAVQLTTSAQPVVTNLPSRLNVSGRTISYSFSAKSAAGVQALQSVTVVIALAP